MTRVSLRLSVLALSAVSALALAARAQEPADPFAVDTGKAALSKISAAYSLTKTGFGSADRVIDPGSMYTFRIEGLLSRTVLDHMTPTNTVDKDGKLLPPAKGFIASFGASGDVQQINPGDRYYLHEINLDSDSIIFTFLSVNTSEFVHKGTSERSRLRMYLRFQLPKVKGEFQYPSPDAMKKMTDPFFYAVDSADARPTVMPGMSEDEVRKVLGSPEIALRYGDKTILVFKSVKVSFVDGKATDMY